MKTSKKAVPIAVIIAVVVIALSVLYLYRGAGEEGTKTGLPAYPGAERVTNAPNYEVYEVYYSSKGITFDAYDVEASLEDVASWYKNKMSNLGWSKENERINMEMGCIRIGWRKNNEGVGMQVTTKEAQFDKNYASAFEDNILHVCRGDWDNVREVIFS